MTALPVTRVQSSLIQAALSAWLGWEENACFFEFIMLFRVLSYQQ